MTDLGPLAHLRAQLAAPRGRARLDALVERDDAAEAVAALPVGAVHELIADIGLADAGPLLALATPEQIQGCLDLEVWDRDRVDIAQARPWIAALLELGFEKVGAVWAGLDAEWRALYLQGHTVIYDLSGGEDPDHDYDYADVDDADAPPVWFTPDGSFALRLLGDEDHARLTMALVDDLYRADMALARHTILAARSEPTASLEETSFRWRSGRLADDGYVDFHEALALFAPLTVEQYNAEVTAPTAPLIDTASPLPRLLTEQLLRRNFLAHCWERASENADVGERLEQALVSVTNQVLAAARVRPGDSTALAAAADYATATISLGLETIARGDVVRGGELLAVASLQRLHRVGFTATRRLARVAAALAPRATSADDVAQAMVNALAAARPWFPTLADSPPTEGIRPFSSLADLRRGAEVLADLALRLAVAERLGVILTGGGAEQPPLDDHARTALARWIASGELEPRALTQAELRATRDALTRDIDRAAALAAIRDHLGDDGGLSPRLAAVVDRWLDDVTETIASLDLDAPVDPRFVDGLLVAAAAKA